MIVDPEAQASIHRMACHLRRVAAHGACGLLLARMVLRYYREALANHHDQQLREQRWRTFLIALHAFFMLHRSIPSPDLTIVESIIEENSDLLTAKG